MNPLTIRAESLALWFADYYLLASALLFATLATSQFLKQPAQRLAIAKATIASLFLLAILCAIPGWSLVHLFTAQQPRANGSQAAPLEPPPVADLLTIPAADTIDTETVAFSPPAVQRRELQSTPQRATNWHDLPWARIVIVAQGAGTASVFAWLILGAIAAHRLQRSAQLEPAELNAVLVEIAALQNFSSRLPDLRISDQIDVAVALGIFRPTVLLPTKWLKSHAPDQLRTVLAHELAHVANHDLRWLAASRALVMLLWAQPLLWFVRRRMRLDQETLADTAAAELTSRQRYAEQLVAWARQVPARPAMHLSAAVGLWEGPSQLRQRVALLLNEHFTVLRTCSREWCRATATAAIMSTVLLSLFTIESASRADSKDEVSATGADGLESKVKDTASASDTNRPENGPAAPPVEIPIIVARHVLLHDGKIIEWADLEKKISALPNPKLAQPGFYFTHGAAADRQEEIRTKIWDLRRRIPMHGHSWGSISPRTSPHYDAIRTADDLKPDDAWRINGTVETADGLPIDGAEVVLLMPVDESLPYKTLDVYLRNERLREPADEVVTTSDNSGRFAVYPRPETPYYLVALHREGFGLARSDAFAKSQRITIQPWAHVRGDVKQDARFKQLASHSERVPADEEWPEITFHQYSEDLGQASPDGRFEFAFVPPNLDGTLSRSIQGEQGTSIGLPAKKFRLPPGETLTIDLEPPSDEEAARVKMLKLADEQRQRVAAAVRAAEEARKVNPNELAGRVVDADGKPLSGVVVDVWTWHAGNETLTDADGRFKLGGFDDREVVEVQFIKPGYGPALFVAQPVGDPNWTVKLANDTYLEGHVLDPAGKPLPNMRIRAARGPFSNPQVEIGEVWISSSTDGEGAYRLYVEPDKYDVHVRVPGVGLARLQNTALAKGEKRQLDIQLRTGPTFRAQVLDIETNEPVAGIRLWNWRQEGIEGVSDDDGMVTIENMTPGPFEFDVTAVGEPRESDLAGKYARWWSPDATEEQQRKIEYDSSSFQRNFDDLTFNILGNTEPVKIYVVKAVSIRGRVTDPDGNSVAGATVAPAKTGTGNSITGDTRYSVRTASDGTFHIRLPASNNAKYNLVAHDGNYQEWRQWANGVGEILETHPGQELANVELQLTRPGVVRGKVIDANGMPVAKHRVRTQAVDKLENRYYDPETRTDENGQFELKFVRPGDHFVQADPFWIRTEQADDVASKRITVEAGKTVDGIELIHEAESQGPSWPALGAPAIFLPSATKSDGINDQSSNPASDGSAAKSDEEKPVNNSGSNLLRNLRLAAAPILARMAREHGYGLAPEQLLRRVPPPFDPTRMEYYRTGHPSQAEAIQRGPSAMTFQWTDGELKNWGMMFSGDPATTGYDLSDILDALFEVKSQSIEGPAELLEARVPGDWVFRAGANESALLKEFQSILQNELSIPARLEFREVPRQVYVARGDYKLTPLPNHTGKDSLHLENETLETDEIEIFGTTLVPNSGAGGGTGEFTEFLSWLGNWIGTPILSEAYTLPKNQLTWNLHERSPSTNQSRMEDRDALLVLGNITRQTGVTFTKEERSVRILFVERVE